MTETVEQAIQTNLAAIFTAVVGIRKAYTAAPMSISVEDCPALVFLPGAASLTKNQAPKYAEVVRSWVARLYVAPIQAGETGDAETDVIPWMAAVTKVLLAHPALGTGAQSTQVPYVMTMEYIGDTGLAILPTFAGQQYLGVEFRMRVTYKVPYTFAANE